MSISRERIITFNQGLREKIETTSSALKSIRSDLARDIGVDADNQSFYSLKKSLEGMTGPQVGKRDQIEARYGHLLSDPDVVGDGDRPFVIERDLDRVPDLIDRIIAGKPLEWRDTRVIDRLEDTLIYTGKVLQIHLNARMADGKLQNNELLRDALQQLAGEGYMECDFIPTPSMAHVDSSEPLVKKATMGVMAAQSLMHDNAPPHSPRSYNSGFRVGGSLGLIFGVLGGMIGTELMILNQQNQRRSQNPPAAVRPEEVENRGRDWRHRTAKDEDFPQGPADRAR